MNISNDVEIACMVIGFFIGATYTEWRFKKVTEQVLDGLVPKLAKHIEATKVKEKNNEIFDKSPERPNKMKEWL